MFHYDGQFEIPGVRKDASALAIHPGTGNLWTITDDKIEVVEFTPRGELVREVKLTGFEDAEGLCHLQGDQFLVAEEKEMRITVVEVPPGVEKVKANGRSVSVDAKVKKNKGLEGISYDPKADALFAVREGKPPGVFRIEPFMETDEPATREWPLDVDGLDDLSDTFFDPLTGWLWLLSHESQRAVAFDARGKRTFEMELKNGRHGLPEDIEQAEGIVRDREGTLYICSEPNLVYRFRLER